MSLPDKWDEYRKVPLKDTFKSISEEPYKLNVYDCSNKCAKYMKALMDEGYECEMIAVKPPANPLRILHAIVRIKFKDGSSMYTDPTYFDWSSNINHFGAYMYTIEITNFDDNYAAFGDRLHEIQQENCCD
jgi:hypothetical protein